MFWTDQGNQPLPKEIVDRFDGKVMAIVGYEADQVMVQPTGKPGADPTKDVSVPINWAYDHHYMAWMTGKHSEMTKVQCDRGDPESHGMTQKNKAVPRKGAPPQNFKDTPISQMFR